MHSHDESTTKRMGGECEGECECECDMAAAGQRGRAMRTITERQIEADRRPPHPEPPAAPISSDHSHLHTLSPLLYCSTSQISSLALLPVRATVTHPPHSRSAR